MIMSFLSSLSEKLIFNEGKTYSGLISTFLMFKDVYPWQCA
jgi:hypothetical protein